ncbi:hypothetical protein K8I61_13580, partial [bacterium]|nr:hypothetical protein [bacterium]
ETFRRAIAWFGRFADEYAASIALFDSGRRLDPRFPRRGHRRVRSAIVNFQHKRTKGTKEISATRKIGLGVLCAIRAFVLNCDSAILRFHSQFPIPHSQLQNALDQWRANPFDRVKPAAPIGDIVRRRVCRRFLEPRV